MFSRNPTHSNDSSRVITYINIHLSFLWFALYKDIFNHRDILLVSFFNDNSVHYRINIYLDSSQSTIKYLKNTEVNLQNILVIMGNFNIRDSLWDPDYHFHVSHSNLLFDIVDSLNLGLSEPINQVPTRYSNNGQDLNSVIDLMFLWFRSEKLDNHLIQPEWHLTSDHAPLTITIPIINEHFQTKKCMIIKNSNKEKLFIKDLIKVISSFSTSDLSDIDSLKTCIFSLAHSMEKSWEKHSKVVNITKYFKSWWDDSYKHNLDIYRSTKCIEDWKQFKKSVKNAKYSFFDLKTQEIANKNKKP